MDMENTTTFTNPKEAKAALRVAADEVWGKGTVELKAEKSMGGDVAWNLVFWPRAAAPGPDMSCTACGMSVHRVSGCPA